MRFVNKQCLILLLGAGAALAAVTADSVVPPSGSGAAQLFTFQYSNTTPASNITMVFGMFNTTSATVSNACFFQYNVAANTLYLYDNSGVGVAGSVTPGSGFASNSQCTLYGAGFTPVVSANQVTITVPVSFTPAFAGAKNTYGSAFNSALQFSGWTQLGTWTVVAGPSPDYVFPASGSGAGSTFSFKYSSSAGMPPLQSVFGMFNTTSATVANACFFQYNIPLNTIFLYDNFGVGVAGTITPGVPGTASNNQCTISGAGASVFKVGYTVTVNVPVAFSTTNFLGAKKTYGLAVDTANNSSGWKQLGTWTVTQPIPTADSVAPNSGIGTGQSFTFKYSDPAGSAFLTNVFGLFNASPTLPKSCFFQYNQPANVVYLYDDTGTTPVGSLAPGTPSSISNSQCTISGAGLMVSSAGNQLSVTVPITFNPSNIGFDGSKNIFGYAIDQAGRTTNGWTYLGGYTIQGPANALWVESVSPQFGNGGAQTFTFKYWDGFPAGAAGTAQVLGSFSTAPDLNGCWFEWDRNSNKFFLFDGVTVVGGVGVTPGTATTLTGSKCSVNVAGVTITVNGNEVTMVVPITFNAAFTGAKTIYGGAMDDFVNPPVNTPWTPIGMWVPYP